MDIRLDLRWRMLIDSDQLTLFSPSAAAYYNATSLPMVPVTSTAMTNLTINPTALSITGAINTAMITGVSKRELCGSTEGVNLPT